MSAFIKRIGLSLDGRTIREVKEQLRRLTMAKLSLGFFNGARGVQYDLQIISAFDLWFPKNEKQCVLWPSRAQLNEDYFQSLMHHAIRSVKRLRLLSPLSQRLSKVSRKMRVSQAVLRCELRNYPDDLSDRSDRLPMASYQTFVAAQNRAA